MLTMTRERKKGGRYAVPPTKMMTADRIKEIARSIPACSSSIDLEASTDGMREDWVEVITQTYGLWSSLL